MRLDENFSEIEFLDPLLSNLENVSHMIKEYLISFRWFGHSKKNPNICIKILIKYSNKIITSDVIKYKDNYDHMESILTIIILSNSNISFRELYKRSTEKYNDFMTKWWRSAGHLHGYFVCLVKFVTSPHGPATIIALLDLVYNNKHKEESERKIAMICN